MTANRANTTLAQSCKSCRTLKDGVVGWRAPTREEGFIGTAELDQPIRPVHFHELKH
jgi:hypothetical protein